MNWATLLLSIGSGVILLAAVLKALPVVWRAVVVVGQSPKRIENIWTALPLIQADVTKLHDCFDRHSKDDERRFAEIKEGLEAIREAQ